MSLTTMPDNIVIKALPLLLTSLQNLIAKEVNYKIFGKSFLETLASTFNLDTAKYYCCSLREELDEYIITEFSHQNGVQSPYLTESLIAFLNGEKVDFKYLLEDSNEESFQIIPGVLHPFIIASKINNGKIVHIMLFYSKDEKNEILCSSFDAIKMLNGLLMTFFHVIVSKISLKTTEDARQRYLTMERIVATKGNMAEVTKELAKIWCELLNADAARFWFYNSSFNELNVLQVHSKNVPIPENIESRLMINSCSGHSLVKTRVVRSWALDKESVTQEALDKLEKDKLCIVWPYFICIPIYKSTTKRDIPQRDETEYFGVIDLHWGKRTYLHHPDDTLFFLGVLTSNAIKKAQLEERKSVSDKLNQLALDLVSYDSMLKFKDRVGSYFDGLIELIKKSINVESVSIFEGEHSRDHLQCIATTGIQDVDSYEKVFYKKGEGLTWDVFETNTPRIAMVVEEIDGYKGKHKDKKHIYEDSDISPYLGIPIPAREKTIARGVIRITEKTSYINRTCLQNFSELDIQLIDMIASHISPILQMIRFQTHRQRFVERTVHQVLQPLQGVVVYSTTIVDGIYGVNQSKIQEKLRYIRSMARSAAGLMRASNWAAEATDFSFLKGEERIKHDAIKWIIERIIDIQPIRSHENIFITLLQKKGKEDLGDFLVNELYFDQAVQNILHNAVKYSYPNTTVIVKAKKQFSSLKMSISSIGTPIKENERETIFLDRARGIYAQKYDKIGTGQGLYISRQIMRGLGGSLTLSSRGIPMPKVNCPDNMPPAELNTFFITLPEAFL